MIVVCAMALTTGCSQKGQTAPADSNDSTATTADSSVDKHTEAYIRQRIDTIYKYVGKIAYDKDGMRTDYNPYNINFEKEYCSQRYYDLMEQASEICEETGDILYDYDYWVCGQDVADDWSYKVAKVYAVTDSTALVDMLIHNFSDQETTIALRFERNDWYVDDFSPSDDGENDKKYLRETIKRGLQVREKAKTLAGEWGWIGKASAEGMSCPELLLTLEMTDKGLKVRTCDVYRLYGFDNANVTYDGVHLNVTENEYDTEKHQDIRDLSLSVSLNEQGDLEGTLHIKHPLASKEYDGPITLRKGYFMYRDGVKKNLSDYAE